LGESSLQQEATGKMPANNGIQQQQSIIGVLPPSTHLSTSTYPKKNSYNRTAYKKAHTASGCSSSWKCTVRQTISLSLSWAKMLLHNPAL
jgi:hypothetical protein